MSQDIASPRSRRYVKTKQLSDTPWNTARCRRLLRPFTNKLNAVIKSEKLNAPVECYAESTTALNQEQEDEEELPPPQRIKRRYGKAAFRRRDLRPGSPDGPGDIVQIPNSIDFRLQNPSPCQSPGVSPSKRRNPRLDNRYSRRYKGRQLSHSEEFFHAYETLLYATDPIEGNEDAPTLSSSKGPPSLMQLCLKNIPVHALKYQREIDEQDPDNKSNIAFEYYELLENTLESSPGKGWDGLRLMVRAHATLLLTEAIKIGHLAESTTDELIHSLWEARFEQEAKELIGAHLSKPGLISEPADPKQLLSSVPFGRRLSSLMGLKYGRSLRDFQLRHISLLLISGKLSWLWLGSEQLYKVWSKLICAFYADRPSPDAETFLEITLLRSCGFQFTMSGKRQLDGNSHIYCSDYLSKEKWDHTSYWADPSTGLASGLLTTMSKVCAICIALACGPNEHSEKFSGRGMQIIRPFYSVWQRVWSQTQIKENHVEALNIPSMMILLTRTIIACIRHEPFVQYLEILDTLGTEADAKGIPALTWLSYYVHQFVELSSAVNKPNTIERLETVLDLFLFENETRSSKLVFLNKLALDVAVYYQSKEVNPDFTVFCESVEARISSASLRMPLTAEHQEGSHSCKGKPCGLKWEAGICEWINSATPCKKKTKELKATSKESSGICREPRLRTSFHFEFARRLATAAAFRRGDADELGDSDYYSEDEDTSLFGDLHTNEDEGDDIEYSSCIEEHGMPRSTTKKQVEGNIEEDHDDDDDLEYSSCVEEFALQTPMIQKRTRANVDDDVDELCMSAGTFNRQFGRKRQKLNDPIDT